jgi:hypothetical protein
VTRRDTRDGSRRGATPSASAEDPGGTGEDGAGLTLAALAAAKRLPVDFLRGLGLHDTRYRGRPAVAIPYLDETGSEVARRFRLSLAGDQRFAWKAGARALPYGLQRLAEARRAGWVLIVEGESDCWTAWRHGLPALGLPGKAVWRSEWAASLAGLEVVIWQEPDAADFPLRLGNDLPEARVIVAPLGVKDLSEAHVLGRDVPALVAELRATAQPVADLLRVAADAETRRLKAAAAPVLAADDPLEHVAAALRAMGYGGDLTPALITYLCCTTRLLAMRPGAMPGHLLLVGPPSAGKSYTLQAVLRLLPAEAYHTIDAGSPRVLIYDDADLRHRVVVFSEADSLPAGEDNPAASAVRNLLQDHHLHYKVTVRDPESGEFTVRDIVKPGPSVLVTTAVRGLGGQLGTRVFTLPVPEDVEKIRHALRTQAELELHGGAEPDAALVAYQAYLQRLAPIDVVAPFAPALAEAVGRSANATRILRDFARLLSLIKAVALLRHAHRERDDAGRIVATIADYATVFGLVGPMYDASLSGATEPVRAVVAAVAALAGSGVRPVTYNQVAERVGLHREQVRRLARIAIAHDWLVNRSDGRHKPADLDVGEPLPERAGLPTPEELRAWAGPDPDRHALSQDVTVSRGNRKEYIPIALNGAAAAEGGDIRRLVCDTVSRRDSDVTARDTRDGAAAVRDGATARFPAGAGADLLACARCGAPTPAQLPVGGTGYRWGRCARCSYVTYLDT